MKGILLGIAAYLSLVILVSRRGQNIYWPLIFLALMVGILVAIAVNVS
jgi:hypothetical protein